MSDETASDQSRSLQLRLQGDRLDFIASAGGGRGHSDGGSASSIRAVLAQGRLTEASLENTIAHVEDLIMPILRALPASAQLKVSGAELERAFQLLPVADGDAASTETLEGLFNELADYAGGSPVAWRHSSLPDDVALGVVVLREVMHHGGFRSVSLVTPTE